MKIGRVMKVVKIILLCCFLPLGAFTKTIDIDKIIKDRVDSNLSVGMVVGIVDPEGTQFYHYGKQSMSDETPVNEDTLFEMGSITKVFTAVLLQEMDERGELSVDDPVEKFLPVSDFEGQKILLKHLASHMSALPYMPYNFDCRDISNPFSNYRMDQVFAFLDYYKLTRDPGESYDYSNLSPGLLAYILSDGSKEKYNSLINERICDPLHLTNTTLFPTAEMLTRLAKPHVGNEEVPIWDFPVLYGTGGVYSTVKDLSFFLEGCMGKTNTVLSRSLVKTYVDFGPADEPYIHAGLGWHIAKRFGSKVIFHNGHAGGTRIYLGFCPDTQRGVIVASNSAVNVRDLGFYLVDQRYKLNKVQREIDVDPIILEKYVGKYLHPAGLIFTVTKPEKHLLVELSGYPSTPIYPESPSKFFVKYVTATVEFLFGEQNDVQGLEFIYAGTIHHAQKAD